MRPRDRAKRTPGTGQSRITQLKSFLLTLRHDGFLGMVSSEFQSSQLLETHVFNHLLSQNQRQKSKAQQQATSTAGGSRLHGLVPRSAGPYQVFNYNPSHYEPSRPYTSPHPYTFDGPPYHQAPTTSPITRRSSRLGYHRRGTSSLSYPAVSTSARQEYPIGSYLPVPYPMEEAEFAHSPASYYEHQRSPPMHRASRSPEVSRRSMRDDTLAPIWPENESYAGPSRGAPYSLSDVLNPVASTQPGPSRPALLPTGLPPPQPLEPTPLWSHPHTNPRYMRPLPPTSAGLPSLLGGLNRGRARSDPPVGSLPPSSHGRPPPPRPSLGLGLQLHGIRPRPNPEEAQDTPNSPGRTSSDPTGLGARIQEPSGSGSTRLRESARSQAESSRPRTARGTGSHSRRSSKDSRDHDLD